MKRTNEVFVLTCANGNYITDVVCFRSIKSGFKKMSELYDCVLSSMSDKGDDSYVVETNEPRIGSYIPTTIAAASIVAMDESYEWRLFRKEVR